MKNILLIIGLFFFSGASYAKVKDAIVLNYTVATTANESGLVRKKSFKIQINNRDGDMYANITIPFSKMRKVSQVEAYIEDANGNVIRKIKKSEIKERSAISGISLYEDGYVKYFSLRHNRYPYCITYSYQEKESDFLHINNWSPFIDYRISTKQASYSLSIPVGFNINYKNYFIDEPIVDTIDSQVNYQWNCSFEGVDEMDHWSPSVYDNVEELIIVPQDFKYKTKGSWSSWDAFGNWQWQLLQGKDVLPDLEKERIDNLIENVTEVKEKIRILYHDLQDNTRYINVTLKTGGYIPYPAQYVVANRYGDCKALSNYFKAVLNHVGIEALYTLIYAGNVIHPIDANFPSSQFNHAIITVPLKGDTLWLDCTSQNPYGYCGPFIQGRNALLVKEKGSEFCKSPMLNLEDVEEVRRFDFHMVDDDNASVDFKGKYKGEDFEQLVSLNTVYNEKERKRIFDRYILNSGVELNSYSIDHVNRDSLSVELIYKASASGVYKRYGNDILVNHFKYNLPELEKPEKRTLPIQINYPICKKDLLSFSIPKGFKLNATPDTIQEECEYGSYSIKYELKDDRVVMNKQLIINPCRVSGADYMKFYDFISKIRIIDQKTFITFSKQ